MFYSNQDTKLVSKNKKAPIFKISKIVCGILLVIIGIFSFSSCTKNTVKSDEDLINERIQKLVSSYNAGDNEGIMECFDEFTNIAVRATGYYITCNDDIFGLKELLGEDDLVQIRNIEFTVLDDETEVYVDAEAVVFESKTKQTKSHTSQVLFHMVKEHNDWFINSISR